MTNFNNERNILEIKELSKSYSSRSTPNIISKNAKRIYALKKVSFRLEEGLYGLLGPNGAGKSTLMNIITCNLMQDDGSVFWNGRNIHLHQNRFFQILGYMPQQQGLYPGFTGRRFLEYFAALKEIPTKQISIEAERVATQVNLLNELDKKISAYSGGMKQRLLAAQALIGDPRLLIMDEPTAGLDPKERVRLRELLSELSKTKIILIATHVVSDVENVADKILLLRQGQLADIGNPQELIDKYLPGGTLEQVYLKIFGDEDMS